MTAPALQGGETALWSGQPEGGIVFRPLDIFIIPFSILWIGMVLSSFLNIFSATGSSIPTLTDFLFLFIGVYITAGRFIVDIIRRRGTKYFVSDKRAIITTSFPMRRTQTKNITKGMSLGYDEGKSSTVWFGERPSMRRGGLTPGMGFAPQGFAFECLTDIADLRKHLDALTTSDR